MKRFDMSAIFLVWGLVILIGAGCAKKPRPGLDADAYIDRGVTWAQKGDWDRASADFTKAIEVNPSNAMAYVYRGGAWIEKSNLDRAIADYTKALELDPGNVWAYISRADAWHKKGDYDRAIADCNKAIKLDPRNASAYLNRGNALDDKGAHDRAIADYNKALEIRPGDADIYYNRGIACAKKGDYGRAMADYNKALEIDPRNAYANNSKAWLLATCPDARYRDGAEAVELAQKAVEVYPKAFCFDTLAAAYAEAGRFEDAITTQEKAIALLKKEGDPIKQIDEYVERLNSYKAHKPWRES
jgi:tetratricopeptide (TPR) repeat protein